MRHIMERLKTAHRFNEPQIMSVSVFTALNIIACAQRDNAPWWLWLCAAMLWPSIAYIANVILGSPE